LTIASAVAVRVGRGFFAVLVAVPRPSLSGPVSCRNTGQFGIAGFAS
jgi:hypothetical protein